MKNRLTFFLLLLCGIAAGQGKADFQSRHQALTLSLGYQHMVRQDLIFSPFIHRGGSPVSARLAYLIQGSKLRHRLDFGLSMLSAAHQEGFTFYSTPEEEELQALDHSFTLVDLNYGLTSSVTAEEAAWQLHAGGAWRNTINLLNYQYGRASFFGYFIASSVGLRLELQHQIADRSRIQFDLDLPLMAWVARSPYLVNDDEFIENVSSHQSFTTLKEFIADGELAGPAQFQQAEFGGRFVRTLSPGFELSAGYGLQFIRHTEPLDLRSWQQRFDIGATLKF